MQGIKQLLKRATCRLSTGSSDIWCIPQGLGCGIQRAQISSLAGYTDSDWAGCKDDRKSTSGACHFLGRSLVSCSSKKQNCVSLSTTEAEYVAAAGACTQLLWMRQTLKAYGVYCDKVPLCVTMKVQSRLVTTLCSTQGQSTLRFVIILSVSTSTMEILSWAIFQPRTNLQICSPSLLMKQDSLF